jgi:hypothetical protein
VQLIKARGHECQRADLSVGLLPGQQEILALRGDVQALQLSKRLLQYVHLQPLSGSLRHSFASPCRERGRQAARHAPAMQDQSQDRRLAPGLKPRSRKPLVDGASAGRAALCPRQVTSAPSPPLPNSTKHGKPACRAAVARLVNYEVHSRLEAPQAARSPPLLSGALADCPLATASRRLRYQRGNLSLQTQALF